MKEAYLYKRLDSHDVRCYLCRHRCRIKEDERGICGVRINRDSTLYTLVYDKVASINVDAMEKKPLFHFLPGRQALSFGTAGCNFRCRFCQNHDISQMPRETGQVTGETYSPTGLVGLALNHQCSAMAYTYTEPTIFYELARDTMVEAKRHGLYNIFVTNGYMTREMLEDAKGLIDAANVDLKAFTETFYRDYVNGRLKGVTDSLIRMKQMGLWVEVTTLLIPGLNDDPEEIRAIARFIKSELDPDTPWHLTRFHPAYKERNLPPTEISVLEHAKRIGLEEGLHYVYLGNVPGEGENTTCPQCSHLLIDRVGYTIQHYSLDDGACPECGYKVAGVGL